VTSPGKRLHPQAYDALGDALVHFYWYRQDFARLLRSELGAHPAVLAGLEPTAESKRDTAGAVVDRLRQGESRYRDVILALLLTLAEFDEQFPHLARLDDGAAKVADARAALERVRSVTGAYRRDLDRARARQAAIRAAADQDRRARGAAEELVGLRARFLALSASSDPRARGLALEPFLRDLFALFDLDPRGAFALSYEQIDGAFTFDTDDYLLEARWRAARADTAQVRAFEAKVAAKTHRTGGLFVSIDGFTPGAVEALTGSGTRLLLMDGADLMAVLDGRIGLDELLLRKRRHAAETGRPYLSAATALSAP
jgi:hypothetical protein